MILSVLKGYIGLNPHSLQYRPVFCDIGAVCIDGAYVREKLDDIVKNEDLSRYIL